MPVVNRDLVVLKRIYNGICDGEIDDNDLDKFKAVIDRFVAEKKRYSERQSKANKVNEEYHRITNKIWYYRKIHDLEQLKFWQNELKRYKEEHKKK